MSYTDRIKNVTHLIREAVINSGILQCAGIAPGALISGIGKWAYLTSILVTFVPWRLMWKPGASFEPSSRTP